MRRFGRIYKPDENDRRFRISKADKPYKNRFWSSRWFGNQGTTSECVGYSAAHLLECSPVRQYINPSMLYMLSQKFDDIPGEDYEGTTVRGALKVLQKLEVVENYLWAWSEGPVLSHLSHKGPVILGIDWMADMEETDSKGSISASGEVLAGHAILADGVDFSKELVRLKNSWGRDWGKKGRATISFKDLRKLIRANGEAACITERKPVLVRK